MDLAPPIARPGGARRFVRRVFVDGMLAGLLSTLALAWRGRAELARVAAPLNAPAHWFFGDESLRRDRLSLRHTATGLAVHQASSLFWAVFYALLQSRRPRVERAAAVLDAAAVTAVAAVVDLKIVPQRLTPGFERRLSPRGVATVYAAFAVGLALSSCWRR